MSEHAEPPVHGQKKVGSGCQECQAHPHAQCEMQELEVKVTYKAVNWVNNAPPKGQEPKSPDLMAPVVTTLRTKKIKRRTPLSDKTKASLGAEVVALLDSYDFVIDSIAGFRTREKSPENVAEFEIKAEAEGHCPDKKHVQIHLIPLTETSGLSAEFKPPPIGGEEHMAMRPCVWKPEQTEVEVKDVLSPTYNADLGSGENVFGKLFQLLMFVIHAHRSADFEIKAETCGKASATESGPREFIALVRVFRDITVAVGFKCPPPMSYSEEVRGKLGVLTGSQEVEAKFRVHDGNRDVTGEYKSSQETRREPGVKITEFESETKIEWKKVPEDKYSLYFKYNELELSITEDAEKLADILDKGWDKSKEIGTAGKEKVNDTIGAIKAWANKPNTSPKRKMSFAEMERLAKTIKDALTAFFHDFVGKMKAIKSLLCTVPRLMKKFPQLGFKLETEIGFLGGDMFAQWGLVNVDSSKKQDTTLHDRYAPLFPKIHLETTVTLVKFKIAGSFGAEIDAGFVASAKAKVEVALTLDLKWSTFLEIIFNMNGADGDIYVQKLTQTTTGELSAEVEAKAVGVTILQKKVGLESGMVIEGKLIWELSKGKLSYQIDIRTLETGWYYYTNDLKTGRAHTSVHTIFKPQPLHHSEGLLRP